VIALMGMIMRNSVILIDQIEHDREQGVPTWTAIVEAAVRRLLQAIPQLLILSVVLFLLMQAFGMISIFPL